MHEKKDWVYARVIKTGPVVFGRLPYWLGWVEFVPVHHLDAQLGDAIAKSLALHGMQPIGGSDRNYLIGRTLVLESSANDVAREGGARIREAVDVLTHRVMPISHEFEILEAGAMIDIIADTPSPLRPPWRKDPSIVGMLDDRAVHPSYILNLLLTAPNGFGPLGLAYARSQHWRMLAREAATAAENVLLHWMAAEALCSARVGEDPVPNLMLVAGFPIGERSKSAAPITKMVRNYRLWRGRIKGLLESARKTRNGIVHEGHRDADIRRVLGAQAESDVLLFLKLALSCLHEHAEIALGSGAAPLDRLWMDDLLDMHRLQKNAAWIVDRMEGLHRDVS